MPFLKISPGTNMAKPCSYVAFLAFILSVTFSDGFRTFDYCNGTSWIKFEDHCYYFSPSSKERVSFYDAEDFCRARGAHLASIHSEEEQQFILKTMEQGFGGRLWIGFNILSGEDRPQWSDGTAVEYQKRLPKEYYVNEKCFIMFLSQRGWRPEHCALHYSPICKRPAEETPATIPPPTTQQREEGNCPENWIQYGQKCYRYFGAAEADRVQYKAAMHACWALGKGYDLVSIHSKEEQAFLTQHLHDLGTSAWIGMRQVTSDEIGHDLVFGWVDNSRTTFTNWAKGHPPPGTWKYCGRLSYDDVAKGEWMADYCEVDKKGYICQTMSDPSRPPQTPKVTKCDAGFTEFRDACYQFVSEPQNRQKAEEKCNEIGGHLVSVVDGFETAFLQNFIGHQARYVWNGLKNVEGTEYLQWSDGKPLYYSNWEDGQPSVFESSCSFMDAANDLRWNVSDCSQKLPFVCKSTNDTSPAVPGVVGTCPNTEAGWIDIGDPFCYHVPVSPRVLSWDSTFRYCLTKGMKMVKVTSQHIMNSLVAYLWKQDWPVHLGLIRSFDKNSFMWVDGSPLNWFFYTNWEDRSQSSWSNDNDNDCVAFSQSTGKWRPINCGASGVPLCRVPKLISS